MSQSERQPPTREAFDALCAVRCTQIPAERPHLFNVICKALGFESACLPQPGDAQ